MKSNFLSVLILYIGLLIAPQLLWAQAPSLESIYYVQHSESTQSYIEIGETNDAVTSFELDVTGDGKPERFFNLKSLRIDYGENVWTIFTDLGNNHWKCLGIAKVDLRAMKVGKWEKNPAKFGFYSAFNGGGGKGVVLFTEVTTNGIYELEKKAVECGEDGKDIGEVMDIGLGLKDAKGDLRSDLKLKSLLVEQIPKISLAEVPVLCLDPRGASSK